MALTTSLALMHVRHETPLRSSISPTMRSWTGLSSTTSTRLGRRRLPDTGQVSCPACSVVNGNGRLTLNTLPSLIRLDTNISPPSRDTRPLVIESPSPNPSVSISGAARSNGQNIRPTVSSSMPMPVSLILTSSLPSVYEARKRTVPAFVNLTALSSRLSMTCSTRSASPDTVTLAFFMSLMKSNPLSFAVLVYSSAIHSRNGSR